MKTHERGNGIAVKSARSGLPVDFAGEPTIDPTKNVLDLVEAERRRQDDLRAETNRRYDAELLHMEKMAVLRAEHAREIRYLESERLEKIRQIDVVAVNTAADRASAAIQALAVTAAANAENLRNALNTTATTIANQLANTVQGINERIAALEKANYEGQGRSAVSDPAFREMLEEVKSLRTSSADTGGRRQGAISAQAMVTWILGLIVSLITIGGAALGIAYAIK